MDSTNIDIRYNRKYGHSYSFNLRIYEGKIFIWRGNGKQPLQYVTFFEDNGLIEWLEELLDDYHTSSFCQKNTENAQTGNRAGKKEPAGLFGKEQIV